MAPAEGRAGMDEFVSVLTGCDAGEEPSVVLLEARECPPEFYANPLVHSGSSLEALHNSSGIPDCEGVSIEEATSDSFILHFYDLSIKKPHFLYHFKKV